MGQKRARRRHEPGDRNVIAGFGQIGAWDDPRGADFRAQIGGEPRDSEKRAQFRKLGPRDPVVIYLLVQLGLDRIEQVLATMAGCSPARVSPLKTTFPT